MARQLTGCLPWRTPDGRWKYTSATAAREDAGLLTIEEYITWRQKTVAQYIATQSLLDLCMGSERAPGEQSRDVKVGTGGN